MIQSFLQLSKNKKWLIFLGLFAFIGGLFCIRNGHEWGDDFALYLSQANAILKGNTGELAKYNTWSMQHSDGTIGPYLYPPGYPLFLTIYLKIFPFNWVGIKIFQWIFYLLGGVAFYYLISSFKVKLPPNWVFYVLAIVLIHPKIVEFSDRLMSDLWFIVTVYLFFYFLYTTEFSKISKLFLIGLSLILAAFTRVNGFILVGSWWIHILVDQDDNKLKFRDFMKSIPFVLVVFAFRKIDNQYESNHVDLMSSVTFSSIWSNIVMYFQQIGQYAIWHLGFVKTTGYVFAFILLFYFGFALKSIERLKVFAPVLVWIAFDFILIVLWPIAQGTRFLLPIIPFVIWIAVVGFNDWIENQKLNRWISLICICLLVLQSLATMTFCRFFFNANKVIGSLQTDIYDKVKLIVDDNDIIAFDKPRWLHLVTDKKAIRKQSDSSFFKSSASYWLVTNKNIYSGSNNKKTDNRLDSIYGNADFTLYRRNDLKRIK